MSRTNVRVQRMLTVLVTMVMMLSLVHPTTSASASNQNGGGGKNITTTRTLIALGTSAPMRDLAAQYARPEAEAGTVAPDADLPTNEKLGGYAIPRGTSGAGASAPDAGRPVAPPEKRIHDDPVPGLDAGWEGISQGINRVIMGFGVLPPDTNGDASYCQYVQTVNSAMAVWDLCSVSIYGTYPNNILPGTPTNALFTGTGGVCEYTNDGDPIVVYDEVADRWIILQFALYNFPSAPFDLCIAVSTSGDATGTYHLYDLSGLTSMPDYPHFGIMDDTYTITVNEFAADTLAWDGQGAYFFDRDSMLNGSGGNVFYWHAFDFCTGTEPECFAGGMLSATQDIVAAPAGAPTYLIEFDDNAWGYSPDQLRMFYFHTDWVANTAFYGYEVDLGVNSFDSEVCAGYARNCIKQLSSAQGLDAISDRLMYRVQYINFGSYQTMVLNHTVDMNDPAGHAGIRWYELRNTGSGWGVYQQGDFAPDAKSRWMGSIAMDAMGNIALGYSVSSTTANASIKYATRVPSDPAGVIGSTEGTIATGGGAQTNSAARWGDYSSMSVDITGCEFYYTTEYMRATSSAEWTTRIGAFNMPGCYTGVAIEPETYIDSNPTDPSYSHDATFTFSGSANGGTPVVSFECAVDAGAWYSCSSPLLLTGLAAGTHTFYVAATNMIGLTDSTPASYTWTIALVTTTFRSAGPKDGYVIESSEASSVGGTINSIGATINVGDSSGDKEVRGILSFDTASLPDGAVVTGFWIQVKKSSYTGTNPFTTHGSLLAAIVSGSFSGNVNLQASDFQAVASQYSIATFGAPVSNWYTGTGTSGFSFVNLFGPTQFKLYFSTDDNDDGGVDTVNFISGNNLTASNRPSLTVEYYVP